MARVWIVLLAATIAVSAQETKPAPQFTADGKLKRPADYREWVYVTSGVGMSYSAMAGSMQSPAFDNVFVRPESYRAFMRTGKWPRRDDVRPRTAGVFRSGIDPQERSLSEGCRRHRSIGQGRAPISREVGLLRLRRRH